VKKTVSSQKGKKIDAERRDKSHVGSQRKEKHVVHLIKMVKKTVRPQRGKKIDVQQRDKSHGAPYLLYLIKVVKKTVSSQRGKKIDVQQRDKSHVGSQRKEKHVKVMWAHKGKKNM